MAIREGNVYPANRNALNLARTARYVFDPSARTTDRTIGAHAMEGDALPNNAVITRVIYDVKTTFTSATDAATIALRANAANDIVSAVAISDAGNPWDSGVHISAVIETAATMIKLTADRVPLATVAVEALTAGKLIMHVEYFLSE